MESKLFTWKDFEINLPVSKLQNTDPHLIDKLFQNFSVEKELLELSKSENGETVKLNDKQLAEIRKSGKFSVKSKHFPSNYHVWSLSKCLYFGTDTIQSFYEYALPFIFSLGSPLNLFCRNILAWSLEQLYHCRDKIIGTHSISLFTSLKLIFENLLEIPKLFIGIKVCLF